MIWPPCAGRPEAEAARRRRRTAHQEQRNKTGSAPWRRRRRSRPARHAEPVLPRSPARPCLTIIKGATIRPRHEPSSSGNPREIEERPSVHRVSDESIGAAGGNLLAGLQLDHRGGEVVGAEGEPADYRDRRRSTHAPRPCSHGATGVPQPARLASESHEHQPAAAGGARRSSGISGPSLIGPQATWRAQCARAKVADRGARATG